jgi:predicted RNA methylase
MQDYIKKIDYQFLKDSYLGNYRTPDIYFHGNSLVRWLFWERLNVISKFIDKNKDMKKRRCIDFGGGNGVFLPTLSELFDEVILVDLEPTQAELVIEKYNLKNCKIIKGNIFEMEFDNIDCIIAADVIEHFDNTQKILKKLKSFMNKDTYLISSLPTENWLYILLRKIFNQQKPIDHYFSSYEIENSFIKEDFVLVNDTSLPLTKPFDLFSIKEWQIVE